MRNKLAMLGILIFAAVSVVGCGGHVRHHHYRVVPAPRVVVSAPYGPGVYHGRTVVVRPAPRRVVKKHKPKKHHNKPRYDYRHD